MRQRKKILLMGCALTALTVMADSNLVRNGSFEQAGGDSVPLDWKFIDLLNSQRPFKMSSGFHSACMFTKSKNYPFLLRPYGIKTGIKQDDWNENQYPHNDHTPKRHQLPQRSIHIKYGALSSTSPGIKSFKMNTHTQIAIPL